MKCLEPVPTHVHIGWNQPGTHVVVTLAAHDGEELTITRFRMDKAGIRSAKMYAGKIAKKYGVRVESDFDYGG